MIDSKMKQSLHAEAEKNRSKFSTRIGMQTFLYEVIHQARYRLSDVDELKRYADILLDEFYDVQPTQG